MENFQILATLLCLKAARGTLFSQKDGGGSYTIGTFGGHLPHAVKVIRVTNTVAVPVPVPVPFPKHIPYPVSVPKPIPYPVPQPIPVEVTKPVVIQQPLPVEVPKPYAVPQAYSLKSFQPQNIGFSIPSEHLTAPVFRANQQIDYQAYLSYGKEQSYTPDHTGYGTSDQENSYSTNQENAQGGGYGYGTSGQVNSYSTTQENGQGGHDYGTSSQVNSYSINQENGQGGYDYGTSGQVNSYSINQENGQGGYDYGTSGQEQQYHNSPSPGLYMVYSGRYSQGHSDVSLGHNFESTNSIDDQPSSGH